MFLAETRAKGLVRHLSKTARAEGADSFGSPFLNSVSLEGSSGGKQKETNVISQNDSTGGPGASAHAASTLRPSLPAARGEAVKIL